MATSTFTLPAWPALDSAEGHSHHAEALPWGWTLIFLIAMSWLTVTRARVIVEREWCELFLIRMDRERREWRVSGMWHEHHFEVGADTPAQVIAELWRLRRTVGR